MRRMRSIGIGLALAVAVLSAGAAEPGPAVVFLLRHAEAGGAHEREAGLNETGTTRAAALADLLANAGVTHLFATEYARAQATLRPLAERLGLEVQTVPAADSAAQLERLRALPKGAVAVVAGHSNTVPALVRGLGGEFAGETIAADSHDRLFVVVLGSPLASFELRFGD